jgi:hypothetical protein
MYALWLQKKSQNLFVIALLYTMGGCSSPLVILPDNIGTSGLLVGQVSSSTWPEIRFSDPMISYEYTEPNKESGSTAKSYTDKVTKYYIGGIRASTIIVPLAPGEYTLDGLKRIAGGSSYSSPYGTYSSTNYVNYPLNINFKIERGRATNVGLIEIEHLSDKADSSYSTFTLDNTFELSTYLNERHHELFNSLENKKFLEGYDTTISEGDLSKLREFIAKQKYNNMQWQYEHANDSVITGNAGTLVQIDQGGNGKPYIRKMYNPYTVADLSDCGIRGSRAVCVISSETILSLHNGAINWYTLKGAAPINSVTPFGQSGILLVDDSRRLHISYDNGESWTKYEGVLREEPLKRDQYTPINMDSFGIHLGKDGYYVFEKNSAGPLVFGDYYTNQHKIIDLPKSVDNIIQVEEKGDKLFLGPENTEILHDEIHFMSLLTNEWGIIEVPTNHCSKMVILDSEFNHIEVYCGDDDVQVTHNRGLSWTKRGVRGSYFR